MPEDLTTIGALGAVPANGRDGDLIANFSGAEQDGVPARTGAVR